MVVIKPKPPTKKKMGQWKKSYDKKKVKPKKLPQGPKTSPKGKDTKKPPKGKTPNWRDSTYLKQESYLKKLLADFNAKQIRSKADVATYYGQEENPGSAEVREKDTVIKTAIKEAAKKKPQPTTKTKGVKAGDEAVYTPKKPKAKAKLARDTSPFNTQGARRPSPPKKGKGDVLVKTKKKAPVKYKTTIVRGKVIRQAVGATRATEGLYQKELAEARVRDKADITDDYAARGVLHSGLYAQKQGDYEKEYGKQVAETNRQKASKYADLAEENRDFLNQQELDREQARLDAVRRKAAKLGKVA